VGTHGRSFWILDDMSPLRALVPSARKATGDAQLFTPRATYRFRRNKNTDTPLPPEEPAGKNPPDGAIIYYSLRNNARGPVTLEIFDAAGKIVRRYSSADAPDSIPPDIAIPGYWVRQSRPLSGAAGSHRFVWDLHYPPPAGVNFGYPISAVVGDTPKEPIGPAVMPGRYEVRLTVNGQRYSEPLVVKIDPRAKMTEAELRQQAELGLKMAQITWDAAPAIAQLRGLRAGLKERIAKGGPPDLTAALTSFDQQAAGFESSIPNAPAGAPMNNLVRISSQAASLLDNFESADMPPTAQAIAAARNVSSAADAALSAWGRFKSTDLAAVNARLKAAGLTTLEIAK
jgi:hypothetical protein